MHYNRHWYADCLYCDRRNSSADQICKKCGKGLIKLYVLRRSAMVTKYIGCSYCHKAYGDFSCQNCQATIPRYALQAKNPYKEIAIGVVIALAVIGGDSILISLLSRAHL